jgi:signal transduction histidine kinase
MQKIVTVHEGQITVESIKGQDTTFTLTLPRAEGWG